MAAAALPRRRRWPGALLIVAAVVALLVALPLLIPALNPFKEQTIDRSQPVLRKSLENLSDYHAATSNMQEVVDVEHDTKLLPSFIKGERTLFVAAGSVDAAVDFRKLRDGAIDVSDDRRAVTITLPPAHLTPARLDTARSRIYDRDRGVLDRIGEAVSDDGGADQQQLYALAEAKLQAAAAADPALRRTAERNTRAMLERLLRGLGFERVTVRFERAPV
jgi:Protein of unknown function (DUF4230)